MPSTQPIELHGTHTGNCLRVAVALEEAEIPYRIVRVDLSKDEHHQSDYLRINPAGRVPVIIDHDIEGGPLVLTQSNAILHYLASKRPGRLWPLADAREIAVADERLLYFITDVIAPSHAAFFIRNVEGDGYEMLVRRSMEALAGAERFVASSTFMAGSQFTLADIAAVTITHSNREEMDWNHVPHLKRWYAQVMARPGVQRGLAAFNPPK